jgi:hypothetical protein
MLLMEGRETVTSLRALPDIIPDIDFSHKWLSDKAQVK